MAIGGKMTTYLELILDYRLQAQKLNHEIDNVTPDAIAEAKAFFKKNDSKTVLKKAADQKILLVEKIVYPTVNNCRELGEIDDLIKKAQMDLAKQKANQLQAIADEIQAHKDVIKQLEEKQAELMINKRIVLLKGKFKTTREELATTDYSLSIFVPK